jgi:hypothetical protein
MEKQTEPGRIVGRAEWVERVAQAASKEFGRPVGLDEAGQIHDAMRQLVRALINDARGTQK